MGNGAEGMKYVLLLEEDFSSYSWLVSCVAAIHEAAAQAIARCIRTFRAMSTWISDRGSHFKNQVMEGLAQEYGIRHRFVIAYSPWANGTKERICREVLRAVRAVISEKRLGQQDWPHIIELVQSALNCASVKRLGARKNGTYRSPLEVMTGILPNRMNAESAQLPVCLRDNVAEVVSKMQ